MKTYAILCFVLALAMFVSPVAVLNFSEFSAENVRAALFSEESENDAQAANAEAEADTVAVLQSASGKVVELSTLEYLVGCVACEMPPDYSEEALKAQTVTAYTNLMRLKTNPDGKAGDADITDDTGTHQGYYDEATRKEKWGEKYDIYNEKITNAVKAVLGQTLTYEGAYITAAYFALCPGRTESAENIWGGDIPYLVSVTSPGDKLSPNYSETVTLSEADVKAAAQKQGITLSGDAANWISGLAFSENGTGVVTQITFGGKVMTGQAFRTML